MLCFLASLARKFDEDKTSIIPKSYFVKKKGNLNLPVFVASTCSELVKDLNLFLESELLQLSRLF